MLRLENIRDLDEDEFMVIDLDTGTVLGTNLVIAPVPHDGMTPGALEDILSSDSAAFDYGEHNGFPLFAATSD